MTAGEPKTSFRPRSTYLGRLAVGSGDGAVLIEPAVAGELRIAAALAGPRPAAGLLYGYCHHDDEGAYTLVDGFVPAEPAGLAHTEADPWAVRDQLRAEAARSYPGTVEVGWWRTAPRPGEEGQPGEEGWPDPGAWPVGERPEGVGLVVFADGTPPATSALPPHPVVKGSVLENRLVPVPPQPASAPAASAQPASAQPAQNQPALIRPSSRDRPARGLVGPPAQSPVLIDQDKLRSRRRLEPERGGRRLELEAQQWVLLAMVVLVLVVIITMAVLVTRALH